MPAAKAQTLAVVSAAPKENTAPATPGARARSTAAAPRLPEGAVELLALLEAGKARVAVVGLGYVGLPLAVASAEAGLATVGFDVDCAKVDALNQGRSYIAGVSDESLAETIAARRFVAVSSPERLAAADVICICVPTPLGPHREPDLSFVERTADMLAAVVRPGQLVVLESTSYPGTTREVLAPRLARSGLSLGEELFIAYSPERQDPGNAVHTTRRIPKVVAGDGEAATRLAAAFYARVVDEVVTVSSMETAEAAKITENVFRAVNIALVNELKVVFDAMGIDVWEVIDAAATKPFGYMPFQPGPGLGGHCIPVDPFYLAWKARAFEVPTRFIELAGEINRAMPAHVVARLERAVGDAVGLPLSRARVLVLGLAYKKNVADLRESPALKLIDLLLPRAGAVDFHDPFFEAIPPTRDYAHLAGRRSVPLTTETVAAADAVLVATDHDGIDWPLVAKGARLVVDTRNVMDRLGLSPQVLVKA